MDQLSDSLGQLSTNAKEWKPPSSGANQHPWHQPQQPPQSINRITSTDSTASASGINVNASNWVPQSIQQQHHQRHSSIHQSTTSLQHQHLDQLSQQLVEEQQQQQQQQQQQLDHEEEHMDASSMNLNNSVPKGPIPPPHQQTFTMNNPISLPLPKTLLNDNYNTALGGSGNSGHGNDSSCTHNLPNHYLSKLYKLYHVDCSNQMEPDDERYKAIPQSFVNAMPLENTSNNQSGTTTSSSNSTTNNINMSSLAAGGTVLGGRQSKRNVTTSQTRSSFGYPSSLFKVTSVEDGRLYCLRRFDNVKCVNSRIASQVSNMWNHAVRQNQHQQQQSQSRQRRHNSQQQKHHVMNHPGLVRLYKTFYINQNRALFFIHEYYPNALTLREALFRLKRGDSGKLNLNSSASSAGGSPGASGTSVRTFHPLSEAIIWSYVTQLVTAIKSVHSGDLAVRVLQLNHILVTNDVGSGFVDETSVDHSDGIMGNLMTNRVRLRINCIGVVDALEYESRKDVEECQKEDMRCLGRIIMSLATGMEIGSDMDEDTLRKCDNYLSQAYSVELHNLTLALITRKRLDRMGNVVEVDPPNIQNVCRVVGEHALDELDSVHVTVDKMDEALAHEYESGRGLRLLLKLGFVNERPEFGVDTRWSESGDCYVLKLFRDYGRFESQLISMFFFHNHHC